MRTTQQMFNPGVEDPETLKAVVVERDCDLESILGRLEAAPVDGTSRNFMIVGPRGMGKTHFLLLIYHGIKERESLKKKYVSLKFSEEEYSIDSLAYFFLRLLEELSKECEEEREKIDEFIVSTTDLENKELVNKASSLLEELFTRHQMKIILCVDNLDEIFRNISSNKTGLKHLRSILQSKDYLLIVGAAPTFFKELKNHDEPFYNFFETIRLSPLTKDGVEELIKKLAEMEDGSKILNNFDSYEPQIRTIVHFTGGVPRLVRMLYYVIVNSEIKKVADYLEKLLDELTPYYQARMAKLSPQQQKIIDTMALLDGPSTPTEIARAGRIDRAIVNAQMKKLADSGFVHLVQQRKRKWRRYDITERMFRIWREMRREKSGSRVKYLADFLRAFYSEEDFRMEKLCFSGKVEDGGDSMIWEFSIPRVLLSSVQDFKSNNFGTAREKLALLFENKELWQDKDVNTLILDYLTALLKTNRPQANEIFKLFKSELGEDFEGTFRTLNKTIRYLETRDEEELEKLFPEEREVVEELVKRIEGEETRT